MVAQPPGDESSGSGLRGPLVGLATATVYFVAAKKIASIRARGCHNQ
jgi:hypothetical protein